MTIKHTASIALVLAAAVFIPATTQAQISIDNPGKKGVVGDRVGKTIQLTGSLSGEIQ